MPSTFLVILSLGFFACTQQPQSFQMIALHQLVAPEDHTWVRALTHFHSPHSYDACDYGKHLQLCLFHLRQALCVGHIDYLFLTDHPAQMATSSFEDLLLYLPGDSIQFYQGRPFMNTLKACSDGFVPHVFAGFEADLMPMGMQGHLSLIDESTTQEALYRSKTPQTARRLQNESGAFLAIPHTEDKDLDWIKEIQPDAIEVYNIHANVDPKIRGQFLGLGVLDQMMSFINYSLDFYGTLKPDFGFMHFLEVAPIYIKKWHQLLLSGMQVGAIAGTDAHENTLPAIAADGERVDSFRRMSRIVANYLDFSTNDLNDPLNIVQAFKNRKNWIVFEGLGIPDQLQFQAKVGEDVVPMGGSGAFISGQSKLEFHLAQVLSPAFSGSQNASIRMKLLQVKEQGESQTLLDTQELVQDFALTESGIYRMELWIRPLHLKPILTDFPEHALREFLWVMSQAIVLH